MDEASVALRPTMVAHHHDDDDDDGGPPSSFQNKRDFKKLSGRRVFGQLCAAAAVVFSEKLVCTRPSLSSPVWLPVKPAPASWHL